MFLGKNLVLLVTSLKSGGDFTGTHGSIEKKFWRYPGIFEYMMKAVCPDAAV